MARQEFQVRVTGMDALRHRLQPGRLFGPVKKELIAAAAKAGQKTAQRAAKPHPADKGTLGRFILIDFSHGGLVARVDVHRSRAGIAFVIEEGRRPGRAPPVRALKVWAASHGIPTPARELQQEIRARGTAGVHFMRQGADVAERVVRTQIPVTEREIEGLWNRG